MINRIFNGKDIGDSAVSFFDKLANLESGSNGGNYTHGINNPKQKYIGRYQLGVDILIDIGWVSMSSTWQNVVFIGEASTKWKLFDRNSFLNNAAAQDEAMMKSVAIRWKTVKKHKNLICTKVPIIKSAIYRKNKIETDTNSVLGRLERKRQQGYAINDFRGRNVLFTSSGMIAASHLCGQHAFSSAIEENFNGRWGIPVDGNNIPCLFYLECLGGHDLSVIIGHRDNCQRNNEYVTLKNDTIKDNTQINNSANISRNSYVSNNSIGTLSEEEKNMGVFIFNGQKFQEVSDNEAYRNDRLEYKKAPDIVFIEPLEEVLDNLQKKFENKEFYNNSYVKYLEIHTGKKVLEENREDIEKILNVYDNSTKDITNKGNIIRQHDFDLFRGRANPNDLIRLQDIIYYIYSHPINNKGRIESLEYVLILSEFSAKYVIYPNKRPITQSNYTNNTNYTVYNNKTSTNTDIDNIQDNVQDNTQNNVQNDIQSNIQNNHPTKNDKIAKYNLPEQYNKYLKGYKDIDEIKIYVERKNVERKGMEKKDAFQVSDKKDFDINSSETNNSGTNNSDINGLDINNSNINSSDSKENFSINTFSLNETSCGRLINELGESEDLKISYSLDENGVRNYPLARRILDNIIIEFLKVQTGFKEEKETRYFDDHQYKDSNIVRNYLLWYIERQKGLDLPSTEDAKHNKETNPTNRQFNRVNSNSLFYRLQKLGREIRVTTLLNDWITSKSAIKVRNIRKIALLIDEEYEQYCNSINLSKDKEILFSLFKDSKSLRDYSANVDSMELYTFYKNFYDIQNIISPTGNLFVNDKCILKCSFGIDTSRLLITQNSVTLRGGKQANISDTTILPFKKCSVCNVCKPELIGKWEKNTDVKVRNEPALLDISTIKCKYGGIISIDDAGQKDLGTAVSKDKKISQAKKEADCIYKLLIDISRDINNNFMQTALKKECMKFRKYRTIITQSVSDDFNRQVNNLFGKNNKKTSIPNSNFNLKFNKEQIKIAKEETSIQKEEKLREKIYNAFKDSYKRVKQLSAPNFDTKEVIKKYGLALCDYEKKKFYSAYILPVIVFGYLMKAANLNIRAGTFESMQMEFDRDRRSSKDIISLNLSNFDISKKLNLSDYNSNSSQSYNQNSKQNSKQNSNKTLNTQSSKTRDITISDIRNWEKIGEALYSQLKNIPTEWDIVRKIRESSTTLTSCPFSILEQIERHSNFKNNSGSTPSVSTSGKNKSDDCGVDVCPHYNVDEDAPWLKIAWEEHKKYKGLKEHQEPLSSRIQNIYFPIAKHPRDHPSNTAWCAAFISYCIYKSGFVNSSHPSVAGYDWGIAPRKGFPKRGWFEGEKTEPFVGAITVFKPKRGYSHVAILVGKTENNTYVFLGGNQNNEINLTSIDNSRIDYFTKPKEYKIKTKEKKIPIIKNYRKFSTIS